jgi:transposase
LGAVTSQFENFYVYGAVALATGESFFLELSELSAINFRILPSEFARQYQDTLNIVLLDNARCHRAKSLVIPENIVCLFLPPYSPEFNPIERLWQDVKDQLAWVLAVAINELERHVETVIKHYSRAAIRSRTSYPYFLQPVHTLCS